MPDPPARSQRARRQFEAILEATVDLVATVDPRGRVLYLNPAGRRMLEIDEGEDVGRLTASDLFPPAARRQVLEEGIPAAVRGGVWSAETVLCTRSGREIPVSVIVLAHRTPSGGIAFLSLNARDVSERRRFEEQLLYLANHDDLTGLFNRRRFHEELDQELARARRYGNRGALLFLDLDDFKVVNDTLGHRVGDDVLVRLARVLQDELRETDIAARLGGDEFAVLLPQTGGAQAEAVAGRLLAAIGRLQVVIAGRPHRLSASIGIALYPDHGTSAEDILAGADIAMYEAKREGHRYCVFVPGQRGRWPPEPGLRARERAMKSQEDLYRRWMLGIARQIEAPVAAVRAALHALREQPGAASGLVDEALQHLERVERLARAMEVLGRSGRHSLEGLRPVSAWDLLLQAAEEVARAAAGRGVRIYRPSRPGAAPPLVRAHPELLREACRYLLDNAVDAVPAGGVILLDWAVDGGRLRLDVMDSGPGVAEELRERVFEPFFTTRAGRAGLGLTLCREIAEAHAGSVEIGSGAAGGARVSLFLPLPPATEAAVGHTGEGMAPVPDVPAPPLSGGSHPASESAPRPHPA